MWAGIVLLLVYGVLHERKTNKIIYETKPQATQGEVAAVMPEWHETFRHQPAYDKNPLERALAAIQAEEDADEREEKLAALVKQIPVTDIQVELNELGALGSSGLAGDFRRQLLRRWAAEDGYAAATWVEALPSGPMRTEALTDVAIEWADCAPNDAVAWAQRLPDATERQSSVMAIANEAVRNEPMQALRLVVELPASQSRDQLLERATMQWASRDGEQAAAWARQIADANLRGKLLRDVAVGWAERNPVAAGTLAVSDIASGRQQDDAIVSIVQRWAQQQPEAAADWVEQFPEGELKRTATEYLVTLSRNQQ